MLAHVILLAAITLGAVVSDAGRHDTEPFPSRSAAIGSAMQPTMGADAAILRLASDERLEPARTASRSHPLRVFIAGTLGTVALLLLTTARFRAEALPTRPIRRRFAATRWLRGPPAPLFALR